MNSWIHLSSASDRPMYQQIIDQVKRGVALGMWNPGDRIPSIRELAIEIGVSVVTVRRAYVELEREGVIDTNQGRNSSIAAGKPDLGLRMKREELTDHLQRAIELANAIGMETKVLLELVERLSRELESPTLPHNQEKIR